MNGRAITESEVQAIQEMLFNGAAIDAISSACGRSIKSIKLISSRRGLQNPHAIKGRPRTRTAVEILDDFMRKVDIVPGSCWIWRAAINRKGYSSVRHDGRTRAGHQIVYELLVGPIPHGLVIDHLCRNRRCVNPQHLEPVTMKENTLRGGGPSAQQARRMTCREGHPFTPVGRVAKPERGCKICRRAYDANRNALRRNRP